LGTECVEFLKAARASQGKLLAILCFYSSNLRLYGSLSGFLSPFCAADALSAANAR
jgi:hypothetical protein